MIKSRLFAVTQPALSVEDWTLVQPPVSEIYTTLSVVFVLCWFSFAAFEKGAEVVCGFRFDETFALPPPASRHTPLDCHPNLSGLATLPWMSPPTPAGQNDSSSEVYTWSLWPNLSLVFSIPCQCCKTHSARYLGFPPSQFLWCFCSVHACTVWWLDEEIAFTPWEITFQVYNGSLPKLWWVCGKLSGGNQRELTPRNEPPGIPTQGRSHPLKRVGDESGGSSINRGMAWQSTEGERDGGKPRSSSPLTGGEMCKRLGKVVLSSTGGVLRCCVLSGFPPFVIVNP